MKVGGTFVEPAFMSTGVGQSPWEPGAMVVYIIKDTAGVGVPIWDVSIATNHREQEVLIPPGARLKISKIEVRQVYKESEGKPTATSSR